MVSFSLKEPLLDFRDTGINALKSSLMHHSLVDRGVCDNESP